MHLQLPDTLKYKHISYELYKSGSDRADPSSGLPHFSVEPHHMSVVANVSLSLSCVAHGPPEPVKVIWLQDGVPLNKLADPVALSPSTLNLTGIVIKTYQPLWFCPKPRMDVSGVSRFQLLRQNHQSWRQTVCGDFS